MVPQSEMTSPSYGMYSSQSSGQDQAKSRNARLIQQHNMMSSMFVDRGLLNKPGENNCFLNSAIQVCVCVCMRARVCVVWRSQPFYAEGAA